MQESIHYAHCYIPASMAAILDEKPQLIAPAVKAFYYRDPVDLQVMDSLNTFTSDSKQKLADLWLSELLLNIQLFNGRSSNNAGKCCLKKSKNLK